MSIPKTESSLALATQARITPKLNIKRQSRGSSREEIQEEMKNCELWEFRGFPFLEK